jgi:hypothetical protein
MRLLRSLLALVVVAAGSPALASVRVDVDISSQSMRVNASSGESYHWSISTGRIGYRTPSGVYRPQRLARYWRSRRYGMAPMPYSIFFRGGYAIHGTTEVGRLGRPASHGCIRLHPGAAAALFGLVQRHGMGSTRIVVRGSHPGGSRPMVARRTTYARAAARPRGYGAPAYATPVQPRYAPYSPYAVPVYYYWQ